MIEVEFYCDEAGRLGYINQPENYRGEFTLVAGLIVEKHNKFEVDEFCKYLVRRFGSEESGNKFHITDMEDSRAQIREEVSHFLKILKIPLVYGANYFQPLHLEYIKQKEINNDSVIKMKGQCVGLSNSMARFKKNAQAEAFFNFYCKAMCCYIQVVNQPVRGLVKTDKIDNKVYEGYKESVSRLHNLNSTRPLMGRHYDFQTGEVRGFGVSVKMQIEDPMYKLLLDSSGKVDIVDSDVSILADVVANSLNHHLVRYVAESDCGPLNSVEAITGYELADNMIVAGHKSMDKRYPYPEA